MAKVYVDAGHGGNDCGAVGVGKVHEANINLIVAKHLEAELKRQGISVKMSRTADTTKELNDRPKEANKWGADIVVSVHCNAYANASANGTETFVYKKGGNAEKIANKVQPNLISVLKTTDRGVKEGNLAMVRDTKAPAILVELAFVTNQKDCAKLVNATYQKNCAIAICKGICSYLGITYKKEETKVANKTKFKDEAKISYWAVDSVKKVADAGIMIGDTSGNFNPKSNITREEFAVVIARALKL